MGRKNCDFESRSNERAERFVRTNKRLRHCCSAPTLGADVNAAEVFGLVCDLPEEAWTKEIRRLRAIYDHARASFPIEITVAGSSGLGWLTPGQAPDLIADRVQPIAREIASFMSYFSSVEKFRDSQVYYLALKDESPQILLATGTAALGRPIGGSERPE